MTLLRRVSPSISFSWSDYLGGATLRDGDTITLPPGRLTLADSDVLAINAHGVTVEGHGTTLIKPTKSNFFTVGAMVGTRFKDFALEVTTPTAAGGSDPAVAFNLSGSVRTHIQGVNFRNVVNGVLVSGLSLLTWVEKNEGDLANLSGSFVQVNNGNGVFIKDNDIIQSDTAGPNANNAIGGAAVMVFHSDTFVIEGNIFQRFYHGTLLNAATGTVVHNFHIRNNYFDGIRKQAVWMIASGGKVLRGWVAENWGMSFEDTAFDMLLLSGQLEQIKWRSPRSAPAYLHGMKSYGPVKAIELYEPQLKSCNGANNGSAGLLVENLEASDDFRIFGGEIGTVDTTIPTHVAAYGVKSVKSPSGTPVAPAIFNTLLQGSVAAQYP